MARPLIPPPPPEISRFDNDSARFDGARSVARPTPRGAPEPAPPLPWCHERDSPPTTPRLSGTAHGTLAGSGVARSDGKIETVGPLSDAASYGWPVPKNSELTPALVAALDSLIRNGEYERIMKQWGIEEGLADQALVNGEPPTTP